MAWWIAQNVVVTAALALLVAVACRVLRIGPVARHALWVIVLVKFITPPLVVWPWALPDPLGLSVESRPIARQPFDDVRTQRADLSSISDLVPTEYTLLRSDSGQLVLHRSADLALARDEAPFNPLPWLLFIWISGSLALLVLEAIRMRRLHRLVAQSRDPDGALDDRVRALAAAVSVHNVRVRVVDGISSPMVWAAGRPQLLWPADLPPDSSDACIDGLIVHELAHIRRRDHVVGWIELAAAVLWWWNPLFWFVRASRREQAELACDAWVISVLPNGRRAYAESLLALSGAAMRGTPSMAVVGIRASNRRVLERRLVMIMKGSTPLRLPVMGLVGLAFAAAMTLPAWAMSSAQVPVSMQTQAPPPAQPATPQPAQPAPPTIAVTAPAPATAQATTTRPAPSAKPSIAAVVQPPDWVTIVQTAPVPSRRVDVTVQQATPPPPPPAPTVAARPVPKAALDVRLKRVELVSRREETALPAEGQKLVTQFRADQEQIQKEVETRIEARRQDLIKQLQTLQEQFTKAGKLDEAVAVRDYLRVLTGTGGARRIAR